ncbi:MAG: hypothetical protein F6J90_41180 [Moorea sp. SIOASIH]|uniref:hypothetical protein n=1 Tax=Moorena sp. SIOASIH TaxID=2607817 RepID=UPI0013B6BF82|nr:hypothetical protein [Moorena sp. SIOASIH]NEO42391.1 hypothetical protein [Moorena sp. SIOASIH]
MVRDKLLQALSNLAFLLPIAYCPPPLVRGVRGDSSCLWLACLLPLAYSQPVALWL